KATRSLYVLAKDSSGHYTIPFKTMMVTVACPVDVEVYKDGNLVGRVKNNAVDEDVTDIDLHVFGEEKNFLIPCDENYQVRLSATGEGEMSYTVEETDTDNYEIKQFSNVALTSGQKMLSDINPDISGNRLYITDDEGNILKEILADGSEIDIAGIGGKRSTETITIGSDVYTVSWNSFVRFDGRKHNGVGLDTDGRDYNETVTTGKVSDVKVVITKNGNIINPSNYKFKNRNNKNASVSIDGITAIQTNERKMPSFSIIFKDEENKDVNLLFKKKKFRYGIFPLELNGDYMSFDRKTTTKNGVTKFKKVTFNPKVMSDQIQPKTLKLKYKSNAGKTDYYTTASENGDIIVHGQNNYYGSVVYKK
ncbi:MAG: hypothetical protein IJU87_09575, partial [Lachnospiraceae bacterium]|nr:hypothetical protein [Lachnospiraceae bacterium]